MLPRRLYLRLALAFVALIVVVTSALGVYLLAALRDFAIHQLELDLATQGRLLAPQLAEELRTTDRERLARYLTGVDRHAPTRIVVVDRDGRLVASTESDDQPLVGMPLTADGLDQALHGVVTSGRMPDATRTEEVAYVALPIEAEGQILGAMRLSYELSDVAYVIRRPTLLVGSAIVAASMLAVVVSVVLGASLTRPITALVRGTEALAAGDLTTRVPVESGDELGQLATAFNTMAGRLQALEQARRDLLSDVSHELHTLAGAMSLAVEALERGALRDPELAPRLVHGLAGHTRLLGRLADDLLETARLESNRFSIRPGPMAIGDVLERVRADFAPEAARRGVQLHIVTDGSFGPKYADADRLVQALGNLVENALRATPTGGTVIVRARQLADGVRLEVSDTGAGIPLADQERLFDRFFRPSGPEGMRGRLGLGLAIVKAIVEAHGGHISVASAPGAGTTFTLTLPDPPTVREQEAVQI